MRGNHRVLVLRIDSESLLKRVKELKLRCINHGVREVIRKDGYKLCNSYK